MVKRVSAFLLPSLVTVFLGCGSTVSSTQFDERDTGSAEESGGEDTGTSGTDTGVATDSSVIEPSDTGDLPPDAPPPDTAEPMPDTTEPPPDTTPPPIDTAPPLKCDEPLAAMHEGHCYIPINKRTYTVARDFCVSLGAHLVTITSAGEQEFLKTFGAAEDRWIGIASADPTPDSPSDYAWITSEPVSYTHWDMGEPNFSGPCVRMRNTGYWADQGCTNTIYGICEREP
jgi:hypothetical protein